MELMRVFYTERTGGIGMVVETYILGELVTCYDQNTGH